MKSSMIKVLVACEFSGVVCRAFLDEEFCAYSCDLLPSEQHVPHLQIDVREVLTSEWHLMVAHPPCTYLASSGARWFKDRVAEQQKSVDFVRTLLDAPIPHIALENPVGVLSSRIRKPDQYVQPWWFGDDASKKTGWWLKNLPKLKPTDMLPGDNSTRRANQTPSGQNKLGPSPDRWKERSRFYPGMARAMAQQWGSYIKELYRD